MVEWGLDFEAWDEDVRVQLDWVALYRQLGPAERTIPRDSYVDTQGAFEIQ